MALVARLQVALICLLFYLSMISATCYWPNGEAATERWLPCPNSKSCCVRGEACLSNGLCSGGHYMNVYRGACTDASWPENECPRVCFAQVTEAWANIWPCSNNKEEIFTCGSAGWASTVCANPMENYTWVSANFTVAQLGMDLNSTSQNRPSHELSSSNNCTAVETGIGIGLGVPLLLSVVGFVWFDLHMRRRVRLLQQQLLEMETISDLRSRVPRGRLQELELRDARSEMP